MGLAADARRMSARLLARAALEIVTLAVLVIGVASCSWSMWR